MYLIHLYVYIYIINALAIELLTLTPYTRHAIRVKLNYNLNKKGFARSVVKPLLLIR